ncbi:MAG: T9SS C-terminal target domain-containing protein, partial [Flavobacteriia bacterium]|nr:T9SS C-terminal target domain-containing protein [Flavobacteriia bacterium]
AQTFYTSPIKDLSCPTENGTYRLSSNCNIADSQDGSNYYGLHWNKPNGWMNELFDDSSWPNATTYTNVAIGVDNKPAYMNFISIFDDQNQDAQFIWSTNVNLDNEVIVRYTVDLSTGLIENQKEVIPFKIQPNPAYDYLELDIDLKIESEVYVYITDSKGGLVYEKTSYTQPIDISGLQKGIYILQAELNGQESFQRFLVE